MPGDSLADLLDAAAQQRRRPDGTPYRALLWQDEMHTATASGLSLHQVECAALAQDIVPERYSRNQKTLSNADQLRLLNSRVAIIGLGGLGGTLTELLARIGVGRLTLVDGDVFDESNLNRQLLSSPAVLGRAKAEIAGQRVTEINPAVETRIIPRFLDAENSQEILTGCGLAVDCLDSIAARFLLGQACAAGNIPLVSAAIGGTSGQATVILPGGDGLQRIYGSADTAPARGIETAYGTLPFTAWQLAAVECAETVTLLLGRPAALESRLLLLETIDHSCEMVDLGGGFRPTE
jgi:molybdopterin-synthase adenylyltransferase